MPKKRNEYSVTYEVNEVMQDRKLVIAESARQALMKVYGVDATSWSPMGPGMSAMPGELWATRHVKVGRFGSIEYHAQIRQRNM